MPLQQLIYSGAAVKPLNELELSRILLGARIRSMGFVDGKGVAGGLPGYADS